MTNQKRLRTFIPMVIGSVLMLGASAGFAMSQADIEFAAKCKPEGEQGQACLDAQNATVRYAKSCKPEGEGGQECVLAGKVVESRGLVDRGGDSAPKAEAAKADDGDAPKAAAVEESGGEAPAELSAQEMDDFKYTMNCKPEGDQAQKCMGMRERVSKFAASCKEEGVDGKRCQMAKKVHGALAGK